MVVGLLPGILLLPALITNHLVLIHYHVKTPSRLPSNPQSQCYAAAVPSAIHVVVNMVKNHGPPTPPCWVPAGQWVGPGLGCPVHPLIGTLGLQLGYVWMQPPQVAQHCQPH